MREKGAGGVNNSKWEISEAREVFEELTLAREYSRPPGALRLSFCRG